MPKKIQRQIPRHLCQRIGRNLKLLRSQNGLKQAELARMINMNAHAISNWETAKYPPDPENLDLLAKIYRVSIDEIFHADPTLLYVLDDERLLWRGRYWGLISPDDQVFSLTGKFI